MGFHCTSTVLFFRVSVDLQFPEFAKSVARSRSEFPHREGSVRVPKHSQMDQDPLEGLAYKWCLFEWLHLKTLRTPSESTVMHFFIQTMY